MHSVGTPLFWVSFLSIVLFLLAVDLGVFNRRARAIGIREALLWSAFWVTLSLSFGTWIYFHIGIRSGLEFFAGYLIELALSVDNVFVFIMIFSYFSVPHRLHHRVLFWGILGALVMRASFILAGSALIQAFHWILYLFGAFLVFTGVKILRQGEAQIAPERNPVVRQFRRLVPMVPDYRSEGFLVRREGRMLATPLALVLIMVETTDLVLATDSIPAIFGITGDPFIVYTSNVCAIMGLRTMYFLLAAVVERFAYLGTGLGIVLIFVGLKMLASRFYEVPIGLSLTVVAVILAVSVILSLLWPPGRKAKPTKPGPPLIPLSPEQD
jgi:tellurite resistance protein TerC